MGPQPFQWLPCTASSWCSPFIMTCHGPSHNTSMVHPGVVVASWHGAAIMSLWHGSVVTSSCCSVWCGAICPTQDASPLGPTCAASLLWLFWSALHGPTPPSHPLGVPLHHGLTFQELLQKIKDSGAHTSTRMYYFHCASPSPFS